MTEQWRPVVGWDGYYEVSDAGNIRSIARKVERGERLLSVPARMMRQTVSKRLAYPRVNLARKATRTSSYVHRLVLEAFVGPCPSGMEALHRNGVSTDNRLVNLRWGTHSENLHDVVRHGHAHGGRPKTHCPQGHLYDPAVLTPQGHQRCRTCARRWAADARSRKAARA